MTHRDGIETIPSADGPTKHACTCDTCNAAPTVVVTVPAGDPVAAMAEQRRRWQIAQSCVDPATEEEF